MRAYIVAAVISALLFFVSRGLAQEPLHEQAIKSGAEVARDYFEKWRSLLKATDFEKNVPTIRAEIESLLNRYEEKKLSREDALRIAATGYGLVGDEPEQKKIEALIVKEFPSGEAARSILFARAMEEKDKKRKAELISDFVSRYPQQADWSLYAELFRILAGQPDAPAARLAQVGQDWIKSAGQNAYQMIEARATFVYALAERKIETERALASSEDAVKIADDLTAGSPLLSYAKSNEQTAVISLVKETARAARGFALLRSGQYEQAALYLTAELQPVIKEVEKNNFIAWKEMRLREIGVRPRVLWLAELYEAQGETERAAKYLLAGYGDDERANDYIRERLPIIYQKMGRGPDIAAASLKVAEIRFRSMTTSSERLKEEDRKRLLAHKINAPAPVFHITTLDRKTVSLADLKGKVAALNFWATWCGPCVAEMPHFQEAAEKYRANPRVVFLAISVDANRAVVRPFIERRGYKLAFAYDVDAAQGFAVDGIPTMILLDHDGKIRYRDVGFGGPGETYVERLVWRIEEMLKDDQAASGRASNQQ